MNRTLVLRAALIVSIAFNIAMMIAIARHGPPPPPHNAQEFLDRVTRHMQAADQATLRQTFDKYQPALDEKRHAADDAMENVRRQLGRETIDPSGLANAMDTARTAKGAYITVFQDAVEDAAPRLSMTSRMELLPPSPHDGPNGRPAD